MSKSHNYFRSVDLNPANGGPINDPRDPRACHYFGFESDAQDLLLLQAPTAVGPIRVLYSFDYDHSMGGVPPFPALPNPGQVEVHGVLAPFIPPAPPAQIEARFRGHKRRHVLVWIDPAFQPPVGLIVEVHVRARAED